MMGYIHHLSSAQRTGVGIAALVGLCLILYAMAAFAMRDGPPDEDDWSM